MSNPQIQIGVTAVDQAKGVLQSVDDKIRGTATNIDTQSTKIVSRTSQMSATVKQNFGSIAQSAAGLAAGITGFATSFGSIDKAQSTAAQANVTYQASLQQLNRLQENGKATNEQLALAQEKVRVNAERLKIAQGDVNDRYATFLANIPSQLISFGIAGSAIMKTLGISHGQAAAGATGQAGATNLLSASLFRSIGAAIAAKFAFLAMIPPPVLIAIVAGTALVSLFAFNVGGLRDRIFELGNAILNFLDHHFKPLADAIRWFIDNVAKPLGGFFSSSMPDSVMTAQNSLASFDNSVVNTGTGITTMVSKAETSFTSLETVGVQSANNINAAWQRLQQGVQGAVNPLASLNLPGPFMSQNNRPGAGTVSLTDASTWPAAFINSMPWAGQKRLEEINRSGNFADASVKINTLIGPMGSVITTPRKLAHGGMLFEDVLGFGTRTGTPHVLHEGEHIIPRGNSGFGGRGDVHIHLHVGSKEIAQVIAGDIDTILTRRHTKHMRITHEAIHGTM